ncbi:FAD:protein FMN transferase [bacterium]|nr:FAD:protein FMN transferase [bacterium]
MKRFILAGLLILFIVYGCGQKFPTKKEFLMDTEVEIILPQGSEEDFAAAFNEMRRIEKLMDIHNPESEISRVNKLADEEPVKVSKEIFMVLKEALKYSRLTSGTFDVSIRPLSRLWGGKGKLKEVPEARDLEKKLPLVNYKNIILNERNQTVEFKRKGMALDLGGIAKGYALDCVIRVLKEREIKEALINAGGDIRVMGEKVWKIGLQHPRKEHEVLAVIRLKDQAIATSGDYQRYFIKEGKRYHHIINPKTGYPANKCMSVTIIGPSAIQTDILATAVFILGPEKGMELIESLNDVEGLIINAQGKVFLSPGPKGKLQISPNI